ncbi:MAG: hypothetical protein GY896_06575 [Gammaproteobacteria bacterium]|nr:hypothetical protein [Gammaproteobacteria bacterium]
MPSLPQADPYYPPLSAQFDTTNFPKDLVAPAADCDETVTPGCTASFWDKVRVKEFVYQEIQSDDDPERDVGAKMTLTLVVEQGVELKIPGLEEAFSLEIGAGEYSAVIVAREEETTGPDENLPFVTTITATPLPFKLLLNNQFLKPVDGTTFKPLSDPNVRAAIELQSAASLVIRADWDGNFSLDFETDTGVPVFGISHPVMLADTGIVLAIEGLSIDLSETGPAAAPNPEWRGVKIDSFTVKFKNELDLPDAQVAADNTMPPQIPGLLFTGFEIGTGGFSGRMCGTGLGGVLGSQSLFGMDFRVDEICLGFVRNAFSESSIKGTVTDFPFFEADIQLALALDVSGNFTVGLADPNPADSEAMVKWEVEDVLNFYVNSIAFEHREEEFLIKLNGELEPLFFEAVEGVSAKNADGSDASDNQLRIPINEFTVSSSGDVSIDGGWITLPSKRYIDFNAFKITLSQVGFGQTDGTTDKSFIGFTGGVKLVEGLDAEAEVKRLQFLWGGGDPVQVKLEGIAVAFEQPNVLRFEGAVDWFDGDTAEGAPGSKGFAGKMEIALLALNNMTINGRVVIGSADRPGGGDFKFFYIDLESQFPTGIPIFSGVSLYGLSGLFALNMRPNIDSFPTPVQWYVDYRAADNVISGSPPPWVVQVRALALGAGVIIGTNDNGYTVNAKVALTIAVPGPVVILDGQANILKARAKLSDSGNVPDFVALAVYDGNAGTFIINIGVFYSLADVISVSGEAEAFFGNTAGDWHLYLGQREPDDKRITAKVLSIAEASTYYMIDPAGLGFGAKLAIGDRWKFGPLKVILEAWFAYDAAVSWRPIQAWGQIDLGGGVELKAFGIGVGMGVQALLLLETPRPFTVDGDFRVKLNLPWPLPDPKASVHLRWHNDGEQRPLDETLVTVTLHSRKQKWVLEPVLETYSIDGTPADPPMAINHTTLCNAEQSLPAQGSLDVDVTSLGCRGPMVPLDSFVSAKLNRSVNDPFNVGLGNAYATTEANRHVDVIQDKNFQYDVTRFELAQADKIAATVTMAPMTPTPYASWTTIPNDDITEVHNNLDVLSKNPFRYYDNGTQIGYGGTTADWTDWSADHYGLSYCLDGFSRKYQPRWSSYLYSNDPDVVSERGWAGLNTLHYQKDCPLELTWLTEEDFILPPYSVFRFTIDGRVGEPDGSTNYRNYRNSVVFHTEGPPLDLAPYIEVTVPEFSDRPHYRGYDVSLRFNENYLNKLYREAASQFFQLQVLDENEQPVGRPDAAPAVVTTNWSESDDTILSDTEQAWFELLQQLGVPGASALPKDDLVFARVDDERAVRPGLRHLVRVWLEDSRLATDTRLDSAIWIERSGVRYVSPDQQRVVLYEFDYLASRYVSLGELMGSHSAGGGGYFEIPVTPGSGYSQSALSTMIAPLAKPFLDGTITVTNSNTAKMALFLRHLLSNASPDDFTTAQLTAYANRTPGYNGDAETLSDTQQAFLRERWNYVLSTFEDVSEMLDLSPEREPLPTNLEVSVLTLGTERLGFLLEFPEAIDLSRVSFVLNINGASSSDITLVPNKDNTRIFVFRTPGGNITLLADASYEFELKFHRDLGARNPKYFHRDGANEEIANLAFVLPDDRFITEAD